jgi:CBS domain containing-hemolysin-like protein
MLLLLLFVALALLVSFACSILESVLLSITPAYVRVLEQEGHPAAPTLRLFRDEVDRPLAAILTLNTVANTIGAAGAGAQAARVFGSAWVGVVSGVLTLLILVGAEIIPKTLGAVHWKRLAPLVARVLAVLVVVLAPFVRMAEWLTDLLTPANADAAVSREEIAAIADEGQREGVMAKDESRVLKNLLRLSDTPVGDIMTPHTAVVSLPPDLVVADAAADDTAMRYSRIPLRGSGNGTRHYVLKDEVLAEVARDEHTTALGELRRELLSVRAAERVPAVFERMLERREHIAAVVDEAGRMAGVVSMEDVVEALLGRDIHDEVDAGALAGPPEPGPAGAPRPRPGDGSARRARRSPAP